MAERLTKTELIDELTRRIMAESEVHISTNKPEVPPDADFAIYIDFKKNSSDPARVFDAELENYTIKETTKYDNMSMTLIVKKPDYLGTSQWEFRHGKKPISANIEHEDWLKRFHNREYDIRPGDALKCHATIEFIYGYDNELIKEKHTITEVKEIWKQSRLLEDGE